MDSLDVSIERNPTLSNGYKSDGNYTKSERIPLYWSRTWLQLQGYFHDEKPYAILNRMEAYNLIRFLRLNRPESSQVEIGNVLSNYNSKVGKSPIITVNTFRDKNYT